MVVKSNATLAAQLANKRLEKVISSHRDYLTTWRSERFDRSSMKSSSNREELQSEAVASTISSYKTDHL